MEHKLEDPRQPVAIIGMGCRFPGGIDSPESLWEFLRSSGNAITEVPEDRWSLDAYFDSEPGKKGKIYTRKGGFLDDVRGFDPDFFHLSDREARAMDPQQRILLETTWESLEDAGIPPGKLRGSPTGVFVGLFIHDYENLHSRSSEYELFGPHTATGTSTTIAANRISHLFDFRGPSLVVDTACSSSLVALNLACRSLLSGESDLAIAGGVNAILRPEMSMLLSQAGMLSPGGACRTFDADGDGYVRAEGVGTIVLKRLADAQRDGDPIRAVVRATSVNQDGGAGGITVPSAEAQKVVMQAALQRSGLEAREIDYVEAHGTGTPAGDPVECRAIGEIYGLAPGRNRRTLVGSVKSNLGHTESTAGIAGLMKLVLMLEHRSLLPNLHFEKPNPAIDFTGLNLEVVTSLSPWEQDRARVGAVNSFGFGGTNAHAIVEEFQTGPPSTDNAEDSMRRVFPIAAASPEALGEMASRLESHLTTNPLRLVDAAHSLALHRDRNRFRAAVIADSGEALRTALRSLSHGEDLPAVRSGQPTADPGDGAVFVFSGMGQQWTGMGRELYERFPVFRRAIDRCGRELAKHTDQWDLVGELLATAGGSRLTCSEVAQPCIFGLQTALAELFESVGIRPVGIVGHSAGEVAAFHAAGVLGFEDACRVSFLRGLLQEKLAGRGTMLAIGLSQTDAEKHLREYKGALSIAAINSPSSVTLSGDRSSLAKLAGKLEQEQVFARFLPVNIPYHGPSMDEILEELRSSLSEVTPNPARIPLVSSVTGRFVEGTDGDAEYWCRNVRDPVRFSDSFQLLNGTAGAPVLEISAHPVLSVSMRETLDSIGKSGPIIPAMRRDADAENTFLGAVSDLFCTGVEPDWVALNGRGRFQRLPSYPFQHQEYWEESVESERERLGLQIPGGGNLLGPQIHPLLGGKMSGPESRWRGSIELGRLPYLRDHRVENAIVFPGAALVEMLFAAAGETASREGSLTIEDLRITNPLILTEESETLLETRCKDGRLAISSGKPDGPWAPNCTAQWIGGTTREEAPIDLPSIERSLPLSIQSDDLYNTFASIKLHYGPHFRRVKQLRKGTGEALGEIDATVSEKWESSSRGIHPAVLDACFQVAAVLPEKGTFLPVSAKRISLHRPPSSRLFAWARAIEMTPRRLRADLVISNESGEIVLSVSELTCRRSGLPEEETNGMADLIHQDRWIEPSPEGRSPAGGTFFPSPVGIRKWLDEWIARESDHLQRPLYYSSVAPRLEELCTQYILSALHGLGMDWESSRTFETGAVRQKLGILPAHSSLFDRLLRILSEDGIIRESTPGNWTVVKAGAVEPPSRVWEPLFFQYPEYEIELLLLSRCGEKLADVLRGEEDPLSLLFPPGDSLAEQLYRNSPTFRPYNRIAEEVVSRLIDSVPEEKTLRVLEVGAGTGAFSSCLLPLFPPERTEYHFTDISLAFTNQARERFAHFPFLAYSTFHLEEDPESQGFEEGTFDLILASDALHTTARLEETSANLRRLLVPGGQLVMTECTHSPRWFDLVFGMLEGWWNFRDFDLRPQHATLPFPAWSDLLRKAGFAAVEGLSDVAENPLQTVILAQTSPEEAPIRDPAPATLERKCAVLCDRGEFWKELAPFLTQAAYIPPEIGFGGGNARRDGGTLGALCQAGDVSDVLFLRDLDYRGVPEMAADLERDVEESVLSNLHALQTLAKSTGRKPLTLWWITAGADRVIEDTPASLLQATSIGLARVASSELESVRVRRVDLSARPSPEEVAGLVQEISRNPGESEVALRGRRRFVSRLIRTEPRIGTGTDRTGPLQAGPYRLQSVGDARGFRPMATTPRAPGPGEVTIRVEAAGVNFKDLARTRGLIGEIDDADSFGPVPGLECSGTVIACGEEVTRFQEGDRVMGLVRGAFASHVTEDARYLAKIPGEISFSEAATVPVAYLSAYYALCRVAEIKKGETVLVHTASGGVGLAAIQLARARGARIFATAGTPGKRAFLKRLGIDYVGDSRSLDFAGEIAALLQGAHLDLVINTLPGNAVEKGLSLLKPVRGRFVDLVNLHSDFQLPVSRLKSGVRFEAFDLELILRHEPGLVAEILEAIGDLLAKRSVRPLPFQVISCRSADYAFELLRQSQHTGKIVLAFGGERVRPVADSGRLKDFDFEHGTCLITGGLGGFGLATARWLVRSGVRSLVLLGRRSPSSDSVSRAIRDLEQAGARVRVEMADVTDEAALEEIIERINRTDMPLRGVIHAAMVLEDASLEKMTERQMRKVLLPKIKGAWILDRLTRNCSLDFFVSYSSFSSVVGASDQGNYAAANAFLDSLAIDQQRRGIHASSISWGGIGSVGYVSGNAAISEFFRRQGISLVSPRQSWKVLSYAIGESIPHLTAVAVDWNRFGRFHPKIAGNSRFSLLLSAETDPGHGGEDGRTASQFPSEPGERLTEVKKRLSAIVGKLLGIPIEQMDAETPLSELGFDSLMAVELALRIREATTVEVPRMTLLSSGLCIQSLSRIVAGELSQGGGTVEPESVTKPEPSPAELDSIIEQMDESEIDSLLGDFLDTAN